MLVRDLVFKKDSLRKGHQEEQEYDNQPQEPAQFNDSERAQLEDQMRKVCRLTC